MRPAPAALEVRMIQTFMIRHAKPRSAWGQAGDSDPGLDETGRAQAEAAADALMALAADVRPGRVFASPLRRCRETAEPFGAAHRLSRGRDRSALRRASPVPRT